MCELKEIIKIVSQSFGVTQKSLLSEAKAKRTLRESEARQVVLYCLYKIFNYTQESASAKLNYTSHGSVQHAVRKVEENMGWNINVQRCIHSVRNLKEDYENDGRNQ